MFRVHCWKMFQRRLRHELLSHSNIGRSYIIIIMMRGVTYQLRPLQLWFWFIIFKTKLYTRANQIPDKQTPASHLSFFQLSHRFPFCPHWCCLRCLFSSHKPKNRTKPHGKLPLVTKRLRSAGTFFCLCLKVTIIWCFFLRSVYYVGLDILEQIKPIFKPYF